MKTATVIRHYGSIANLARALGIRKQSIYGWAKSPPPLRQLQIERDTAGKFRAVRNVYALPSLVPRG